ncbi:hypothetical protein WN943_019913 [Citrus x changshan-huyou]
MRMDVAAALLNSTPVPKMEHVKTENAFLFSDSGWDMAPYIEATDSQQSSCFILKFFCDLLRIRWESTRCRTKGRALEMMDKLVEGISNSSPGVTQRIPFCYVI